MKTIFILSIFTLQVISATAQLPGNSLNFTADSQYVEIPDANSASLNNNMTIELWVYYSCLNDTSSTQFITKGWCGSGSAWSYYFGIDHQRLNFQKRLGSGCGGQFAYYLTNNAVISFNTWTHVAIVITDSSINFYVNGQSVASSLTDGTAFLGIQSSTEPIRIAAYRGLEDNLGGTPKGNLDDIRIWHTARTKTQIASNYNKELTGNEPGLFCYWKLNETGFGANINVHNSAAATSALYDGITRNYGTTNNTLSFENTNSVLPCLPAASIANKSTLEGDTGTKQLKFPVTLSNASSSPIKIKYKTINNTAKAGSDYIKADDSLIFYPGQTKKTISITIKGDTNVETNETFYVKLYNPVHATILNDTAIGTIRNDDTAALNNSFSETEIKKSSPTFKSTNLYPNPAKDMLYIETNNYAEFSISDVNGKVLLTKWIQKKGSINVSTFPSGLYFLKNNSTGEMQKIIIQK